MPKHSVEQAEAKEISRRLRQLVADFYDGNLAAFGHAFGASHSAYTPWFRVKGTPTLPSVPFLLKIAQRRHGPWHKSRYVSLDALLVGRGSFYRRFQRLTTPPTEVQRMARHLAELMIKDQAQAREIAALREALTRCQAQTSAPRPKTRRPRGKR